MLQGKRAQKVLEVILSATILAGMIVPLVTADAPRLSVSTLPEVHSLQKAATDPIALPFITTESSSAAVPQVTTEPLRPKVQPLAAPPLRLVYEAAGIDLPVEAINQPGLYFDPPLVKTASYWLDQFGQPGERSTNTTYIVAHSGETGGWPFNQLSLSTKIGDVIEVYTDNGVVRFGVTSIKSYEKRLLEDNTATPVSDIDGRRLVLISCKSGDVWQQNIVVMATML